MPIAQSGGSLVTSSNIVNDTIINEDVASNAAIDISKISGSAYRQLASVSLGVDAASLSSGTITARKHLRVLIYVPSNSVQNLMMEFNLDTGNNYTWVIGKNGAASTSGVATNGIAFQNDGTTAEGFIVVDIYNVATKQKYITAHGIHGAVSFEVVGIWNNTAAAITSIQLIGSNALDLISGTEMIVLGMD